ncbi:MAG: prepilin-type N-terminal cleavage/methylation domain-containing protein [FCB group bacterium]|nr:prepilin-type N-terminal cleavage/methylation domain-containing protein [FCB group bacterium]
MKNQGFTLLEVMVSVAILGIVMGMLFALSQTLNRTAMGQDAKITAQDEARQGLELIVNQLRQAASASLAGPFPGPSISYRVAGDVDGNGSAVDISGALELLPARTIRRDTDDLNGDRETVGQLVLVDGANVRVLTNGLMPNEDVDASNTLGATEDTNFNRRLDRGIWFERAGQGIRVTIQTQRRVGAQRQFVGTTLTEIVTPRN